MMTPEERIIGLADRLLLHDLGTKLTRSEILELVTGVHDLVTEIKILRKDIKEERDAPRCFDRPHGEYDPFCKICDTKGTYKGIIGW